jgi:uncharacterized protein
MRIQLINTSTTHIGKSLIYQLTGQFLNQFKIKKPGSAIGRQVGNLVCYLYDILGSEGIY